MSRPTADESAQDSVDDDQDTQLRRRFGEFVRRVRKSRGFTVEESAQAANVSFKTYVRIERGQRVQPPSIDAIDQLLDLEPGTALAMVHTGKGYPEWFLEEHPEWFNSTDEQPSLFDNTLLNTHDDRSSRTLSTITNVLPQLTIRDLRSLSETVSGTLRLRLFGQLERKRLDLTRAERTAEKMTDEATTGQRDSSEWQALIAPLDYLAHMLRGQVRDIEQELAGFKGDIHVHDPRQEYERGLNEGESYGEYTEIAER